MSSAGSERRRAAAEVDRVERRRDRAERGVQRVGAQVDLARSGREERADPRPRPACGRARDDDEVAVRAERDAERDVDVQRDGRRRRRAAANLAHRSREVDSREPMTRQPSGGRRRCSISSTSRAARHRLADVPGAQEDREARDGVAQEGRRDAAGDRRQPAADEPDPERQDEQVAVAAGCARAASSARTAASG